jgi:DNA-binding MarR family transcriptional regulator
MQQVERLNSAMAKASILIKDSDDRFFERYQLGKTRYYALLHLHQAPGLLPSELSKLLLCTKGNTTRLLRSLEAERYLYRQADGSDRRVQKLFLTSSGEELYAEATLAYTRYLNRRFSSLAGGDILILTNQIEKLIRSLEADQVKKQEVPRSEKPLCLCF